MKKILLLIVLFSVSLIVNAQKWDINVHPKDELTNTPEKTVYTLDTDIFVFTFDDTFTFRVKNRSFEESLPRGFNNRLTTMFIFGLYDDNDKLIEKIDILCQIYESGDTAYPNRYTKMGGNNSKRVKKVLDYVKNNNGYVRVIAPLNNGDTLSVKIITCSHQ